MATTLPIPPEPKYTPAQLSSAQYLITANPKYAALTPTQVLDQVAAGDRLAASALTQATKTQQAALATKYQTEIGKVKTPEELAAVVARAGEENYTINTGYIDAATTRIAQQEKAATAAAAAATAAAAARAELEATRAAAAAKVVADKATADAKAAEAEAVRQGKIAANTEQYQAAKAAQAAAEAAYDAASAAKIEAANVTALSKDPKYQAAYQSLLSSGQPVTQAAILAQQQQDQAAAAAAAKEQARLAEVKAASDAAAQQVWSEKIQSATTGAQAQELVDQAKAAGQWNINDAVTSGLVKQAQTRADTATAQQKQFESAQAQGGSFAKLDYTAKINQSDLDPAILKSYGADIKQITNNGAVPLQMSDSAAPGYVSPAQLATFFRAGDVAAKQQKAAYEYASKLTAPEGFVNKFTPEGFEIQGVPDDPTTEANEAGWYVPDAQGQLQRIGDNAQPTGPVIPNYDEFNAFAQEVKTNTQAYEQQQRAEQAALAATTLAKSVGTFEAALPPPDTFAATGASMLRGPDGSEYAITPANLKTGAPRGWYKVDPNTLSTTVLTTGETTSAEDFNQNFAAIQKDNNDVYAEQRAQLIAKQQESGLDFSDLLTMVAVAFIASVALPYITSAFGSASTALGAGEAATTAASLAAEGASAAEITAALEAAGFESAAASAAAEAATGIATGAIDATAIASSISPEAIALANATADPIAALSASQGWTAVDTAYLASIGASPELIALAESTNVGMGLDPSGLYQLTPAETAALESNIDPDLLNRFQPVEPVPGAEEAFRVEISGAAGTAEAPSYAIGEFITPGSELATQAQIDAGLAAWNPAANAWEVASAVAPGASTVTAEMLAAANATADPIAALNAAAGWTASDAAYLAAIGAAPELIAAAEAAGGITTAPVATAPAVTAPAVTEAAGTVAAATPSAVTPEMLAIANATADPIAALNAAAGFTTSDIAYLAAIGATPELIALAEANNAAIAAGAGGAGGGTVVEPGIAPTQPIVPVESVPTPPVTEVVVPPTAPVTPPVDGLPPVEDAIPSYVNPNPPPPMTLPEAIVDYGSALAGSVPSLGTALAGAGAAALIGGALAPTPPVWGGWGAIDRLPFKKLAPLETPGVNPGYFVQPPAMYNTTSPVQSQYYWGQHPYQAGTQFSPAAYNAVPNAPAQPWGLQQMYTPTDITTYLNQYGIQAPVSGPVAPV